MSKNIPFIFFLALIIFSASCKKKSPENIGLDLLPGEDLLNAVFTDTATLITHTFRDDSLRTDETAPLLLGAISDPIFGLTKSSIYTQLALSKTNPDFGTNPVLDSAVLSLVYNYNETTKKTEYYGKLVEQGFKVYEVDEAMSTTSDYYSNKNLSYSTEIGSANLVPDLEDSVYVDTNKLAPQLRIKLDNNFCQKFLTDPSFTSSYSSTTNFQNVFKGLYIAVFNTPSSGEGAILYMNMTDAYTRLTLYYHNNMEEPLSYYFSITNDDCARFSHFDHNYSLTPDINWQLNPSSPPQQDKVFVQPMAGLRTKITMPYLNDFFKNGKVAINKAELILPVETASLDTVFSPHPKLVATIADSALGPVVMPDYYEGTSYFGGDYDATNKVYKFNIALYVQQVLNGKRKNQGLYIITNARPTTANRVQLIGGNQTLPNHMRLKITYTPLE